MPLIIQRKIPIIIKCALSKIKHVFNNSKCLNMCVYIILVCIKTCIYIDVFVKKNVYAYLSEYV